MSTTPEARPAGEAREALEIVAKMMPILMGKPPAIQGAVLAELTALWFAGHQQQVRDTLMRLHNETVAKLTAIEAVKVWGE